MKIIVVIALTCFLVTLCRATEVNAAAVPTYELYSWQDVRGVWNFCLLYTSNRQKTSDEIFDAKTAAHGMTEIKRKISDLPKASRIVWFDRLTLSGEKLKGTEALKYPPKEIVEEVKRCAGKRGIEVFGPRNDAVRWRQTISAKVYPVLWSTLLELLYNPVGTWRPEDYDNQSNLLDTIDQLGHTKNYSYDASENATFVTKHLDANTPVSTYNTYNCFSEVLTSTDPLGHTTTNTYHPNGNLLTVTSSSPDGSTAGSLTQFAYDTKGELTTVRSAQTRHDIGVFGWAILRVGLPGY